MKIYVALAPGVLPIGAMFALQALGIVIVYKTSRVFDFATGAIGLACAYNASSLVAHGVPIIPAVVVRSCSAWSSASSWSSRSGRCAGP